RGTRMSDAIAGGSEAGKHLQGKDHLPGAGSDLGRWVRDPLRGVADHATGADRIARGTAACGGTKWPRHDPARRDLAGGWAELTTRLALSWSAGDWQNDGGPLFGAGLHRLHDHLTYRCPTGTGP